MINSCINLHFLHELTLILKIINRQSYRYYVDCWAEIKFRLNMFMTYRTFEILVKGGLRFGTIYDFKFEIINITHPCGFIPHVAFDRNPTKSFKRELS